MKKFRTFTVSVKIIFITVVILLTTIGVNTLISSSIFTTEYSDALQSNAEVVGLSLKEQLDRLLALRMKLHDISGFEKQCQNVVERYDEISYAMVVDIEGNVLFHNDMSQHGRVFTEPAILQAIQRQEMSIQIYYEAGQAYYDITIPVVTSHDEHIAAVKIGSPVELVTQKTRQLQIYSASTMLISLLVATISLVVAIYLWVDKPLSKLLLVITEIRKEGTSGLTKQVEIDSQDEIGQLGEAFNRMISELETRTRELTSSNEQLQWQITERKRAEEAVVTANKELIKGRDELERRVQERTAKLQQLNREISQQSAQLTQAKQKAEAANQAKSEFLSSMSHELRTPLNAVLGYAQILQRQKAHDPTQVRDAMKIIHQSGKHLLTLINDILDLAKIEAGKMELYPTEIDLRNFLTGIVGIIRMRAEEKELLFTFDFDNALPLGVEVDETRLRQVLINLLSNAVKFTDKGQVTLRVSLVTKGTNRVVDATQLRFEVCDSGVGMSPQDVQKIFLPFEQVGKKEDRSKGTGLGLPITRQLVALMGGEIKVKSQLGQGSTFCFDLNLPVVDGKVTEEQTQTVEIVGYQGPTRKILVVDDLLMNRLLLRELLSPLGFEVIEAENGQEAVELAVDTNPALILMDIVMPVMSGPQAVREIRKQPVGKKTTIIALSANLFAQEESLEAGCDAFLPKPVDADQLLAEIERFLQLTWEYAEPETDHKDKKNSIASVDEVMIPPPAEELAQLYRLAELWDLMEIEQRASQLEQDARLVPFARQLRQLAGDFKGEEILALIEPYLDRNSGSLEHGLTEIADHQSMD